MSLKEINELERTFLSLIDYKVNIDGSEYAKYYFILNSFAIRKDGTLKIEPLSYEKAKKITKKSRLMENQLKRSFG